MGYTHYYTQKRYLTEDEWTAFTAATLAIIGAYGERLSRDGDDEELGPLIGSEVVMFNGMPGAECEPFEVVREKTGFQFVKTRDEPYDAPVTACLAAMAVIAPGAFDIGTDGNSADWKPGLSLARKACPSLAIRYPVTR